MQKLQPVKRFLFPVSPVVLLLALMLSATMAQAEMFKWVDDDGTTHYGDRPPEGTPTQEIKGAISSYTKPSVESLPDDFFDHLKRDKPPRKKVVMYSAEWCGVCRRAKTYFDEEGIDYTEYDIEQTDKGRRDYKRLNGRGVPIILVGKQRMNGFSAPRFEELYY
jgi:glutaredoxin